MPLCPSYEFTLHHGPQIQSPPLDEASLQPADRPGFRTISYHVLRKENGDYEEALATLTCRSGGEGALNRRKKNEQPSLHAGKLSAPVSVMLKSAADHAVRFNRSGAWILYQPEWSSDITQREIAPTSVSIRSADGETGVKCFAEIMLRQDQDPPPEARHLVIVAKIRSNQTCERLKALAGSISLALAEGDRRSPEVVKLTQTSGEERFAFIWWVPADEIDPATALKLETDLTHEAMARSDRGAPERLELEISTSGQASDAARVSLHPGRFVAVQVLRRQGAGHAPLTIFVDADAQTRLDTVDFSLSKIGVYWPDGADLTVEPDAPTEPKDAAGALQDEPVKPAELAQEPDAFQGGPAHHWPNRKFFEFNNTTQDNVPVAEHRLLLRRRNRARPGVIILGYEPVQTVAFDVSFDYGASALAVAVRRRDDSPHLLKIGEQHRLIDPAHAETASDSLVSSAVWLSRDAQLGWSARHPESTPNPFTDPTDRDGLYAHLPPPTQRDVHFPKKAEALEADAADGPQAWLIDDLKLELLSAQPQSLTSSEPLMVQARAPGGASRLQVNAEIFAQSAGEFAEHRLRRLLARQDRFSGRRDWSDIRIVMTHPSNLTPRLRRQYQDAAGEIWGGLVKSPLAPAAACPPDAAFVSEAVAAAYEIAFGGTQLRSALNLKDGPLLIIDVGRSTADFALLGPDPAHNHRLSVEWEFGTRLGGEFMDHSIYQTLFPSSSDPSAPIPDEPGRLPLSCLGPHYLRSKQMGRQPGAPLLKFDVLAGRRDEFDAALRGVGATPIADEELFQWVKDQFGDRTGVVDPALIRQPKDDWTLTIVPDAEHDWLVLEYAGTLIAGDGDERPFTKYVDAIARLAAAALGERKSGTLHYALTGRTTLFAGFADMFEDRLRRAIGRPAMTLRDCSPKSAEGHDQKLVVAAGALRATSVEHQTKAKPHLAIKSSSGAITLLKETGTCPDGLLGFAPPIESEPLKQICDLVGARRVFTPVEPLRTAYKFKRSQALSEDYDTAAAVGWIFTPDTARKENAFAVTDAGEIAKPRR